MNKKKMDDERRIKVSTLVYGVLVLLIIFIAIGCVLAYGTRTEIGSKIAAKISAVIPFPAAIIGWRNVIYINDLENNLASVEKFYQSQDFAREGMRIDFTTEDGKKRLRIKEREILDKMVENDIVEMLAKQRGILVTDADADRMVAQKLNEYGTANDVKADLLKSYGWSIDDFKKHVVIPSMYMEDLAKKVAQDELNNNTAAKDIITKAQQQLESGKDFADVARSYSQGPSKDKGGELGWAKKAQVLPELQDALFANPAPTKNAIIESSIGFHIVDIESRKKEGGEDILQLRQIFVAKKTFADWLQQQKKQMKVSVPLADFVWNSKEGQVDFRDLKMRDFESLERLKMQGDASITF